MEEIYKKYAETQKQIDGLELLRETLRLAIAEKLPAEGVKNESLTAFWKVARKWKYSPLVEGLTAELKATKSEEEEKGIATCEESKQLNIKINE